MRMSHYPALAHQLNKPSRDGTKDAAVEKEVFEPDPVLIRRKSAQISNLMV